MQSHPTDKYQIGIICALPKELKAVRAIFDEEHAPLQSKDGQDNNSYILGRVGKHNVVAAGLPAGVYGTTSATSVGKDMLRTFSQLRFGLLVGIGGGVPNPKGNKDIRLGDVVVSQPDATHGGVVQYDLGKLLSDSTFERKGSLDKPPAALLTALTTLQSELDGNVMAEHLQDVDSRHPLLKEEGYDYPGLSQDKLHCTRCDPSHWWWMLWVLVTWLWPLWRCDKCDNGLVRRASRRETTAVVHYGTIASANVLLKNGQRRDQLREEIGALCVEMEAAGLMDSFPCLVVRGICDYADSQKNDVWQEYASLTAAVFAKQLLGHILPQMREQEDLVRNKLDQYLQRQEAYHLGQEAHQLRQEAFHRQQEIHYQNGQRRDCHRVFKTSDYEGQKNINPDALSGTCRWVLDHPHYQSWLMSAGNDLLWVSADPGCGKSVLSKLLCDKHLRYTSDTGAPNTVCYFFFKDNDQQNGVATALCAILHQLFSQQPHLIRHALPAFDKSGDKLQSDTHALWRIIQSAASDAEVSPIFCVLDALDECREADRASLIDLLCQSYRQSKRRPSASIPLKWFVTSRPYDDVRDRFEKIPRDLPSIRLRGEDESEQIREEINLVIRQRVEELSQQLRLSIVKTEEVLHQLLRMEHRTYLWLYLAIDAIRDSFRNAIRPRDEQIVMVPGTVEEAYERILGRIHATQREYAMAVLTIIVGARRPLTVREMALALDIATLHQAPTTLTDLTIETEQLGDMIRRWCSLFVLISGDRLYLLHQTAKEFLLNHNNKLMPSQESWKYCLSPLDVEEKMAIICIRYLCLSDFNGRQRKPIALEKGRPGVQTFFHFAAEHWASYTQPIEGRLDKETQISMQALYDRSSERWAHWTSAMWRATKLLGDFDMNHVQLAAYNGHNVLLQKLLKISPDEVHSQGGKYGNALTAASYRGHETVVQILLDKGADVNAQGGRYDNALTAASWGGYETVVQILLDKGADVHARGGFYSNALTAASCGGHETVVQILLDKGADVHARVGFYGNALTAASYRGHETVVQILLDKGADVNAQGGFYGNALTAASYRGHETVVQILLDKGADVHAQGGDYGNALTAASWGGHETVVQILLDKGADVHARGAKYGNALYAASAGGYDMVMQILYRHGAIEKLGPTS